MKNKIITIYELMGFIKDGKAPKRIKYEGIILEYNELFQDYKTNSYFDDSTDYLLCYLFKSAGALDTKVEILPEENDEWEDIEEINNSVDDTLFTMECYTGIPEKAQDWNFGVLKNKINQLIKNQQKIIEKLESKDER